MIPFRITNFIVNKKIITIFLANLDIWTLFLQDVKWKKKCRMMGLFFNSLEMGGEILENAVYTLCYSFIWSLIFLKQRLVNINSAVML